MNLSDTSQAVSLALGIFALLAVVAGWLRWVRPKWRSATGRIVAALDTIAGREAITDTITGRELAPPLPSIGRRMESVEGSVSRLVEVIESQAEQNQRLDNHESRIEQLEAQVIERIAAKAESVSAWRAVEAVAKQADPPAPPLPPRD